MTTTKKDQPDPQPQRRPSLVMMMLRQVMAREEAEAMDRRATHHTNTGRAN